MPRQTLAYHNQAQLKPFEIFQRLGPKCYSFLFPNGCVQWTIQDKLHRKKESTHCRQVSVCGDFHLLSGRQICQKHMCLGFFLIEAERDHLKSVQTGTGGQEFVI